VVARTDGGGIVARVPTGVPTGDVPISVSTPRGKSDKTFLIRRVAVVVRNGLLYFLRVDRNTAVPLEKPLSVPGARAVRISSDGAAAYVVATRANGDYLLAIDLCAAGGPKPGIERKLPHHAALLAAAMDAPLVALVGDGQATLVLTRDARSPALYEPIDLPMGAKAPRAVELSPDGKLLALLVPEGNKLVAMDVETPEDAKVVTTVEVLPEQKLPLVRDLAFSMDGETVWIVSGDNEKSLPALQPTRLSAVRVLGGAEGAALTAAPGKGAVPATAGKKNESSARPGAKGHGRLLSLWRTQTMPGASAPVHLAVARGQPVASGTTIRMPPEKAAVFVTAVNTGLFKLSGIKLDTPAGAQAAQKLWKPPAPGMVVRADINGGGGPMFATAEMPSAVDLTPDAQLLAATSVRMTQAAAGNGGGGVTLEFGITWAPIWSSTITPKFLALDKLSAAELKPPFHFGDIRIQP
jgi:hypothetical protein